MTGRATYTAILALAVATQSASAQSSRPGDAVEERFSELGELFDRFDVARETMYRRLVEIDASPATEAARNELRRALAMRSGMTMDGTHAGMAMDGAATTGPFGELEGRLNSELTDILSGRDRIAAGGGGRADHPPLTPRAQEVIRRGADFEARVSDIYADEDIADKHAAVEAAVEAYLQDAGTSVAAQPKSRALLQDHPYASAFSTGFPELNGLAWAMQWLQLASLDPLMAGGDAERVRDGVDTTIQRFRGKLVVMRGMTMTPTEFPAVPTISPLLYIRHPAAAIIIDNLNMLQAVIADVLAHPDVPDRTQALEEAVDAFTDRSAHVVPIIQYLESSLRGGIFNQGGPALGEMSAPERNSSEMEHRMAPPPPTAMPSGM